MRICFINIQIVKGGYIVSNYKNPMTVFKFVSASLIGIILFLFPVWWDGDGLTIPIAWIAGLLGSWLENVLPIMTLSIIVISAILSIIYTIKYRENDESTIMKKVFNISVYWLLVRVIGAIFAIMTFFKIGPEMIYSENTGGLLFSSLIPVLVTVFFLAAFFLPLLLEYGFLEFVGALFTKIMRPLFTLPGRSTVDILTSWVGDGTVGVMLTSQQYEQGFYSRRESVVIATTFSIVSITFAIVIMEELELNHVFGFFYLAIILAGIICGLILPRIPPLSLIKDTYTEAHDESVDLENIPDGYTPITFGYENALKQAYDAPGVLGFIKKGGKNAIDMLFGVLPVVMAIGTIATIIAEYTSFFTIIGMPFVPILEFLQIPEAQLASETVLVGFTDMYLPAILITDAPEMTKFVIGALSISQLIYLSEVGGVILASKIRVNIGTLFIIFLLRTLISLPIIALIAHLIY